MSMEIEKKFKILFNNLKKINFPIELIKKVIFLRQIDGI